MFHGKTTCQRRADLQAGAIRRLRVPAPPSSICWRLYPQYLGYVQLGHLQLQPLYSLIPVDMRLQRRESMPERADCTSFFLVACSCTVRTMPQCSLWLSVQQNLEASLHCISQMMWAEELCLWFWSIPLIFHKATPSMDLIASTQLACFNESKPTCCFWLPSEAPGTSRNHSPFSSMWRLTSALLICIFAPGRGAKAENYKLGISG